MVWHKYTRDNHNPQNLKLDLNDNGFKAYLVGLIKENLYFVITSKPQGGGDVKIEYSLKTKEMLLQKDLKIQEPVSNVSIWLGQQGSSQSHSASEFG